MNTLQASAITGYRSGRQRGLPLALIALVVSALALVLSWRATDAATVAVRQAQQTAAELRSVVEQINRGHVSLRRDLDATARGALLTADALDAVARSCPGRARAPALLDDARAALAGGL